MEKKVERWHATATPSRYSRHNWQFRWYLPQHLMVHPGKLDELRIVPDCTANHCGLGYVYEKIWRE